MTPLVCSSPSCMAALCQAVWAFFSRGLLFPLHRLPVEATVVPGCGLASQGPLNGAPLEASA